MEGDDIINAMQSWHKNREECEDKFEMNRSVPSIPWDKYKHNVMERI